MHAWRQPWTWIHIPSLFSVITLLLLCRVLLKKMMKIAVPVFSPVMSFCCHSELIRLQVSPLSSLSLTLHLSVSLSTSIYSLFFFSRSVVISALVLSLASPPATAASSRALVTAQRANGVDSSTLVLIIFIPCPASFPPVTLSSYVIQPCS